MAQKQPTESDMYETKQRNKQTKNLKVHFQKLSTLSHSILLHYSCTYITKCISVHIYRAKAKTKVETQLKAL